MRISKNWALLTAFGITQIVSLNSCKKSETDLLKNDSTTSAQQQLFSSDDPIRLIKKLNDPYTVESMRKAYKSLQEDGTITTKSEIELNATHQYVRFLPKDEWELHTLKLDTALEYYEYPLNYELSEGVSYHDPSLPDSAITWQYTVVPIGYQFPNIQVEVLEDIILDEPTGNKSMAITDSLYWQIEDRAMSLAGYEESQNNQIRAENSWWRPKKWNPAGKITVWDDALKKYIPIQGVKIRAKQWYKSGSVVTNHNGDYYFSKQFRRAVNYSLVWEGTHFDVRAGIFGQATYNGPKLKGKWNLGLGGSGYQRGIAHVFRAAFDYYNKHNQVGVVSPPKKTTWRPKLKIAARRGSSSGGYKGFCDVRNRYFGALSTIHIFEVKTAISTQIYPVTIHEIAHYSHWGLDKDNFDKMCLKKECPGEQRLAESWGYAMPFAFYKKLYNYDLKDFNENEATTLYTSLISNMIDKSDYAPVVAKQHYLGTVPEQSSFFIYSNDGNGRMYYTPIKEKECPVEGSGFDGTNCHVKLVPNRAHHFIDDDGNMYLSSIWTPSNSNEIFDLVNGYKIGELEQCLKGCLTFNDFENSVRNKINNPTERYLDELFDSWPDHEEKK